MKTTIPMLDNEHWWGGTNVDGVYMPFDANTRLSRDFRRDAPNETMPFYVSDQGRVIWSEAPFAVTMENGVFTFEGEEVTLETGGDTLREGFLYARKNHFPIDGRKLNRDFFKTVQYNTWIECLYHPTQEKVLRYAEAILENGFEPGILMIDEGWHGRYGNWSFDLLQFPNPKEMVEKLHNMGFKVLLWVVPYVCPDGEFFIEHLRASNSAHKPEERLFLRSRENPDRPALYQWWNGCSAMLNLSNPADYEFLDAQLQTLIRDYGIDGFKFDGGSIDGYASCIGGEPLCDRTPAELNAAWNNFAAKYDYHEYKDTFKGARNATIQRLCDRAHVWDRFDGFSSVVPDSIAQGLIGHPFICPDMVGGGEWSCFKPGKPIDGELFVRWAQCSALFPMMQYSKGPWACLSREHCDLVIAAGKLHKEMTDEIIEMVARAEETGEPILRNLEYNYPRMGYEKITDQFMLEDSILVAPVTKQGARSRNVILPPGTWQAEDGTIYDGGEHVLDAPLDRLIWFRKLA